MERNVLVGTAAASCGLCFWSSWVVISRFGVTHALTIYDIAGLRFTVGSLAALPWILWFRTWRGLTPGRTAVLSFCSGVPYALLSYLGFTMAPAAHGGVFINGCLPIFTSIVAWIWLKERIRNAQIVGLGVILVGVFLVGYEGFISPSHGPLTWLGDLVFIFAISIFAVFMVGTKVWLITPGQILFSVTLVGGVIYVPIWLLFLPSNLAAAPWSEILLQGLFQGLVPSVLGIALLGVAIRNLGANAASVFMSAVPVVSALAAIPVLGEVPGLPAWIGMFLVTAGILLGLGVIRSRRTVPLKA